MTIRWTLARDIVVAGLVGLTAACGSEPADDGDAYAHVMSFDTARVRVIRATDTLSLLVELATDDTQRSMGLMERRHLADSAGMLFVYDRNQPGTAGFWMYRTRIPLDIAFLDSAGVIRSIRAMTPCTTDIVDGCPTYAPDVPYRFALEMNAGFFTRHRLAPGDTLRLPGLAK
jgi:uncharacterized membrane protein (UPF0127 family)